VRWLASPPTCIRWHHLVASPTAVHLGHLHQLLLATAVEGPDERYGVGDLERLQMTLDGGARDAEGGSSPGYHARRRLGVGEQ